MPKVNVNGVNIYHEVHGQGEPLVLLHHGLGCTKMWEQSLPGFAARYKVILYDRRGFGETHAWELFSLFVECGGAYGSGVFDLRDILKNVHCPALVLYPDRSRLFEVEQGVLMYRLLPKGELAILPNCGHNTYALEPEQYQRIILSFFERHR